MQLEESSRLQKIYIALLLWLYVVTFRDVFRPYETAELLQMKSMYNLWNLELFSNLPGEKNEELKLFVGNSWRTLNPLSALMVVRCWTRAYYAIICRGPRGISRRLEPLKGIYCFFPLSVSGGLASQVPNLGKVYRGYYTGYFLVAKTILTRCTRS